MFTFNDPIAAFKFVSRSCVETVSPVKVYSNFFLPHVAYGKNTFPLKSDD